MFLKFDGILFNQGLVANIKRIPVKEPKDGKEYAIELNIQMGVPSYEYFSTKEAMNRRFTQLEELVGCSNTGGL